jgi:hypothetical protein
MKKPQRNITQKDGMKCEKMARMLALMPIVLIAVGGLQAAQPSGGGLTFTAPAAWRARAAASAMRVAEFVVPRAPGDAEDAELIVYFFGGTGGSVDANINRWIGQMQQPDGSPSTDKARRDARTINGLKATIVDLTGTYVAEVRPGATEHYNKPNFRLRAAVIETPRGPYYIKMTGPEKTMAAADADFKQFLETIHGSHDPFFGWASRSPGGECGAPRHLGSRTVPPANVSGSH